MQKIKHDWKWHDQFDRYPFNDKLKRSNVVDVWRCARCGCTKNTTTGDEPRAGNCDTIINEVE